MNVTGTYMSYYHFCHRRLWLFAHNINMEHTSDFVADGKLIDETSYGQRAAKYTQIEVGRVKIDFYDKKNKVIHETKRSKSYSEADVWQLKYYIYVLEMTGMEGVSGILEYPNLRKREEIWIDDRDRAYLKETIDNIQEIIDKSNCPPRVEPKKCKNCAYFDFCWAE